MDTKEPQDKIRARLEVKKIKRILMITFVRCPLMILMITFVRCPLMILSSANYIPGILLSLLYGGAFYVETKPETVKKIVDLANVKPGVRAADLGSGDGRIVIALAEAGAEAHGYEINPLFTWLSNGYIRRLGLRGKAFIHRKSYWHEDLSKFDIITVYGYRPMMKRLEEKLKTELKTDARVICNKYHFPAWLPSKKEDDVYLYERFDHKEETENGGKAEIVDDLAI